MKLSDIKNERTMDVIAATIGPMCKIAKDKEATEFLQVKKVPEGMDAKSFMMDRVSAAVPVLLGRHKREVIEIFAAIEGVTPEEYAASLNIVKLCKDVIELLADEAFVSLFISAQSGQVSSGSVQGNIEAVH